MTVRRRICRALACPRRVDERVLFCNVHWGILTPRLQAPITDNKEAPAGAGVGGARRVLSGVSDAVTYIARKEGRARGLKTAIQTAASDPGQGGAGGSGSGTTGGSIAGESTPKTSTPNGGGTTGRYIDKL